MDRSRLLARLQRTVTGEVRRWNEARVSLYSTLHQVLPSSVRNWIGGSAFTAPLRRLLIWPNAVGRLVETDVTFEGHSFLFSAPLKTAATVRKRGGIENGLCRLILEQCGEGAIALDVGANYGFVSLVMAQAVGKTGEVHSFEADAKVFRGLHTNIEDNGLTERCHVIHGFVGASSSPVGHVSVDDYVASHRLARVDFLKIDVDGPDAEVLEGARETLERFHPIVAIEMTQDQERIMGLLEKLGYELTDMQGQDVDRTAWPPNVLAAVGRRLRVPPRRAS